MFVFRLSRFRYARASPGGEWISTIEIENLAMSHPVVAEAAVIAIPNAKWGERPLLVVVLKPHVEQEGEHEAIKEQLYK